MLFREEGECVLATGDHHSPTASPILHIRSLKNQFIISSPNEQMWLPIRYIKNPNKRKGHRLTEGDMIKLGRVALKVKHICFSGEVASMRIDAGKALVVSAQEVEACRICLSDDHTESNPLISPCSCSGTMKHVHIECLQEWLKNKVKTRSSDNASSYYWKDISCELCKDSLPSCIEVNGQSIELVSINYPEKPYILLEDYRSNREQSYGIHIISLDRTELITIGRAHESDIKLSDISVSRKHATIRNIGDSFVIEDLNSKFGSLLLLNSSIGLSKKSEFTIQLPRTLLSFSVKEKWSFKHCITCGSDPVFPEYLVPTMGENEGSGGPARGPSLQNCAMNSLHLEEAE